MAGNRLHIFLAALLIAGGFAAGCGDERIVAVEGTSRLQGVWEGTMTLTASGQDVVQTSRIRLELVQQEFTFDGFLIRIDPLAEGFGRAPADTFVVSDGTISGNFISFRSLEPGAGGALFEGTLVERTLSGSTQGTDFSGEWQAAFIR